jgi:non-heme chloroperoxidase
LAFAGAKSRNGCPGLAFLSGEPSLKDLPMSFVKAADGAEIYVEDVGQGQPIVMIHGWPLSGAMWEYQMVPLVEAGFRVVTYDRRGFGRSCKNSTTYDYATLGADLAAVIAARDLRDVTLVGFSMGGGEVVEYLTKHNAERRVGRAILVASIAPFMLKTDDNPDGVDASVFDEMIAGLREDRPAFLTDFTEKFFGVGMISSPVSNPMLAASCEVAMTASPYATIQCVRSFSATDLREQCKKIDVPVLVIHGDTDATVPIDPTGACAANIIPNAELKIYPGAPHGLFYTDRVQLTRDIAAFASEGRIALPDAA